MSRRGGRVGAGPGNGRCPSLQSSSRARDPLLELGRDVIDVKAVEEIALIERERFPESRLRGELVEGDRVALEGPTTQRELVARRDDDVLANQSTDVVQRLAQGTSGFIVAELRPEQGEEGVAADRRPGRLDREVSEQRHPL